MRKEVSDAEQKAERRKKMLALKPSRTVKRWKIRPSLRIPGVLLILLAGQHRGKRVVCLGRQRSTGLLVVTGPYRYNGCPLRRVHPNMVIATRTRISLGNFELPRRLHQKDYFARKQINKTKSLSDASIFLDKEKDTKYEPDETRKQDQKTIDEIVCKAIKAHPESSMLVKYLKSLFSLGKHDRPHKMLF
ncbi:Ribosomal protein L6 [Paragonimus heterotremus]|uniref:Large ribosomal subunit protein eL6 n=1 Tax=Paragonimus heterotremus TaxID=100268 RepID=A0A8J4SRZ2_9TREM|nr:Ribosomal protein L6 [Paragonimus heterotremus]